MLDADRTKIVIACRFIQHDQWLTTHVEPTWTVRQLKLWLVHRLFQISIPPRLFVPSSKSGKQAERPPSPITFAPDPSERPASPIVFAPPKRVGIGGWFSETDEDPLSSGSSISGFSSPRRPKNKGREDGIRIGEEYVPGGRIGPESETESSTGAQLGFSSEDAEKYPGGVNPGHWTVIRYSTGQMLEDNLLLAWYDIAEYELLELHGLCFPSVHPLHEYQFCHLWNRDRHRERERLRMKLKKKFEAEAREGNTKNAAMHAQILKAMNLNSGAGANVGVLEYYGSRLAVPVKITVARIPRSIDVYVQPYWEGWVRTLRIVYKGDRNSGEGAESSMPTPYRYGTYGPGTLTGGLGMGVGVYHLGEKDKETRERERERDYYRHHPNRQVRVEWRERWVRIQNGTLAVLKDREDEDATHVLRLRDIVSLNNTSHLHRYLSYTSFNPPRDHPSVHSKILIPAPNLPVARPPPPAANPYDDSDSDDMSSSHHHGSTSGGHKEYNFSFPNNTYLQQHIKARELTPLVGSRNDPTYLPLTIEEQMASGLRVVCLQFRNYKRHNNNGANPAGLGEEQEIDPVTLALEDMKERAGEWGGVRAQGVLWKCPPGKRREPLYLERARAKMRMRIRRGLSGRAGKAASASTTGGGNGGLAGDGTKKRSSWVGINTAQTISTGRVSTIRGLGGSQYAPSVQSHSQASERHRRDRIYEHEERVRNRERAQIKRSGDGDSADMQGVLNSYFFGSGGAPGSALEEHERKREREKRKKELKEMEKEKAKQGKWREKEKEENDWGLGSLNVAFWNWGKRKREKREQHGRERDGDFVSTPFAPRTPMGYQYGSDYELQHHLNPESASIAGTSTTITANVGATTAMASSDDEDVGEIEFRDWGRERSETSAMDDSEDERASGADVIDEEEVFQDPEPDSRDIMQEAEVEVEPEGDDDDELEYAPIEEADLTTRLHMAAQMLSEEDEVLDIGVGASLGIPSVVVQVEVDKRVETESPPGAVFGRQAFSHGSPRSTMMVDEEDSGTRLLAKRQSQRLIGQLHSSDDERMDSQVKDVQGEEVEEEEDGRLSSPVFAPPPHRRRRVGHRDKSESAQGHVPGTSVSSLGSSVSIANEEDEGVEYDDDEDLDDEILYGQRRAGYRYGYAYSSMGEEKRRRERELEVQREKEAKIREQKELEKQQEIELEKAREREKDKEREKEKKKKDREGEWVCLDIGNDFAFQSFLRIIHQHCPHPMKSNFMERMLGGPFNDTPPPPQTLPQPLPTSPFSATGTSNTTASVEPGSPQPQQSQTLVSVSTESVAEGDASPQRSSVYRGSQHSHDTDSVTSVKVPSEDKDYFPSEDEPNSETEFVAPLPGYVDPRFMYPARTFAAPPYPEWRLNVLRQAQRAGMGDVGRSLEMVYWGREDPVVAGASGAMTELERMGKSWGVMSRRGEADKREKGKGKGAAFGFGTQSNVGWGWGDAGGDNVSSLGTIGGKTVGSGSTVKDARVRSNERPEKRASLKGKGTRSTRSGASVPKASSSKEGGESGNESSGEESDGSTGAASTGSSDDTPFAAVTNRYSKWSDEDADASELEWLAWQMDIRRQAKRQYAIQARREANAACGISTELDLGLPVDPADDMRRFMQMRRGAEPTGVISLSKKNDDEVSTPSSYSHNPKRLSHSHSGSMHGTMQMQLSMGQMSTGASSATGTSTRIGSETLSPHHGQSYHTLHHSTSLHTGLRKGAQDNPLRRPSMPILTTHDPRDRDKGKGKDRSFWGPFGGADELRSPTTASSGWFSSRRSDRDREKDLLSPGESQPGSASGSVGRSSSILLKGGFLRKKDSGDVTRERERERERDKEKTRYEGESKKDHRPQLRVATSPSRARAEASRSPEHARSPSSFAPRRLVRRMKSDASVLSVATGAAVGMVDEAPPSPQLQGQQQGRKKKGTVEKFVNSALDFVEGR